MCAIIFLAYVLAIPPVDEAQPEGGHAVARPDASSSPIKPLTTRNNLKTEPMISFKPEILRDFVVATLYGSFLHGNIARIELIAKEGDSLDERRQLRAFTPNGNLLTIVHATKSLLTDNPAANSQKDPSLLQIFESLLLATMPQTDEQPMRDLQNDIVAYQERRDCNGMPNNEYVAILYRERLPNGWGPWQRSVQPLV